MHVRNPPRQAPLAREAPSSGFPAGGSRVWLPEGRISCNSLAAQPALTIPEAACWRGRSVSHMLLQAREARRRGTVGSFQPTRSLAEPAYCRSPSGRFQVGRQCGAGRAGCIRPLGSAEIAEPRIGGGRRSSLVFARPVSENSRRAPSPLQLPGGPPGSSPRRRAGDAKPGGTRRRRSVFPSPTDMLTRRAHILQAAVPPAKAPPRSRRSADSEIRSKRKCRLCFKAVADSSRRAESAAAAAAPAAAAPLAEEEPAALRATRASKRRGSLHGDSRRVPPR